ncbi:hypothetical protein M408DRAFT_333225 [Serendipita vermifera MAFF 305830]|uniref:Uncharacterized protein n=1 Tax=Serendipita vermifera MAFF 305830 TaxID=933852 RepID=A0A0C3AB25_SERVB|nr:hypothetical protein M408DRAFT_333225 [Serendipita vermifera MAFF 305830]
MAYEHMYGQHWDDLCRKVGVRLEDAQGRRIPGELKPVSLIGLALDTVEEVTPSMDIRRGGNEMRVIRRFLGQVAGRVWKRNNK